MNLLSIVWKSIFLQMKTVIHIAARQVKAMFVYVYNTHSICFFHVFNTGLGHATAVSPPNQQFWVYQY